MLTRKNRFHGYNSLRFTYKRGNTVRGSLCALRYVRNSRLTDYRAAVVVSKKVHKSAVVRNRIRRRVYKIIRDLVKAGQPYDMIFTVYSDRLATMPTEELVSMVLSKLESADIETN